MPTTEPPCLFLTEGGKAVPQVRPGLEFVLTGWGICNQCPTGSRASCVCNGDRLLPVRAYELIAGEPGRELTTALGHEFSFTPLNFFQDVRLFLERYDPPVWGILWRLGDTPVAQVLRSDMGLEWPKMKGNQK